MTRVRSARQKDEDMRRARELERGKRGFERNFKRKVEKPCNGCDEEEDMQEQEVEEVKP